MGLFTKKIKVTFIDKDWNRIKTNITVDAIPRVNELIYLGDDENYYKVSQVIHWPSKKTRIFIVIESLSNIEEKCNNIINKHRDNDV